MIGRPAVLSVLLALLAAIPVAAQEAGDPSYSRKTCLAVSAGGDYRYELPCPEGLGPLLERLYPSAEPAPRRDIVIDPEWPHDQAMRAEHDWPHDWAMVVPQTEPEGEVVPLLDDLLGLVKPYLSNERLEDGRKGRWQSESGFEQTAD